MQTREIVAAIAALPTMQELQKVIEAVRLKSQLLQSQAAMELAVGDKVEFTSIKTGQKVLGTVAFIKRKFIEVNEDGARRAWRVSPTMLRRRA